MESHIDMGSLLPIATCTVLRSRSWQPSWKSCYRYSIDLVQIFCIGCRTSVDKLSASSQERCLEFNPNPVPGERHRPIVVLTFILIPIQLSLMMP